MTTEENIAKLWEYHKYCKNKKCPRNTETQDAIEDCIKILQERFQEIRARDKLYEDKISRDLIKLAKKKKKK